MKRFLVAVMVGAGAPLLMSGPAAAHTQTVSPPGQDAPIHDERPIARAWVQGHCRAQSPAVAFVASGGVVDFFPRGELTCRQDVTTPGGQVTGP